MISTSFQPPLGLVTPSQIIMAKVHEQFFVCVMKSIKLYTLSVMNNDLNVERAGLDNLTNKVRGHVHGIAQQWPLFKRRQYGVYLLHKAFQIFQITSPPQLHEHDL